MPNFCKIWDVWARHSVEGKASSPNQPSTHSGIKLVPGNVVMVTIDMDGKKPLLEWIYGITERIQSFMFISVDGLIKYKLGN